MQAADDNKKVTLPIPSATSVLFIFKLTCFSSTANRVNLFEAQYCFLNAVS